MGSVRRVAALRVLWETVRGSRKPGAPGTGARLAAVPRMLGLGLTGRYPYLGKGRMALAAFGLLYVLSPVDAVPEIILPLIGLGDDALVAAFVAGSVLSEADAFLEWESQQARTVPGEVVR